MRQLDALIFKTCNEYAYGFKLKGMETALKQRSDLIVLTEPQKNTALDSIAAGTNLDQVAKSLGFSMRTFFRIMDTDPEFGKEVSKAREVWVHGMVESLIGITKGCKTMAEVSAAKIESENIKWASGKYIPEIYGERLALDVNHHLDLSSVLLAAEGRVLPILQAKAHVVQGSIGIVDTAIVDTTIELLAVVACDLVPDELKDLI